MSLSIFVDFITPNFLLKKYRTTSKKTHHVSSSVSDTHKILEFSSPQHPHLQHLMDQQKLNLEGACVSQLPFNGTLNNFPVFPVSNSEQIYNDKVRGKVESGSRASSVMSAKNLVREPTADVHIHRLDISEVGRRVQLVFIPFHVLHYTYKGEQFYCVINGVNGEVTGDRKYGTGMIGEVVTKGWNFVSNLFGSKKDDRGENNASNN